MNHKINQDVIRKHARVPRSYRDATGKHCHFKADPGDPPTWMWVLVMSLAAIAVLFLVD